MGRFEEKSTRKFALFYFLIILIMSNELETFEKLSWKDKIQYVVWFYQWMITKTDNQDYISKFQDMIKSVNEYQENEYNSQKLVWLYNRIMLAKEKTKQKKSQEVEITMKKNKEKLKMMQDDDNEQDPDEFLVQEMAKIGL